MKKRKELNALIGLAADGRRKKAKKGSGHRLLRTEPPASDSESTSEDDDDDFGGLAGSTSFLCKGEYLKCCKICYPLCAFVILAACVVACVGLVWMQVALKEDLDSLKEKFRTMESNQKSSFQEIPKLNEDLLMKQKKLENIESGDMGLRKVWLNLTDLNTQIALLTSAVNHLKANIKAAADLISLPNTVEELQKSVATIGSTLNSVHDDVEKIHTAVEEQKKKTEALQNDVSNQIVKNNKEGDKFSSPSTTGTQLGNSTSNESLKQGILDLHNGLDDLNATIVEYQHHIDLKLQTLETTVGNVSQRVTLLESDLPASTKFQKRDNITLGMLENVTFTEKAVSFNQTENDTEVEKTQTTKSLEKIVLPDSKLREKLQLINALTNKPESDKQPEESKTLTKVLTTTSRPTSLPRFSPRSLGRSGDDGERLSLPGLSGLDDLQDLFKKSDQGLNGTLSYEDLQKLLSFKIQESKDFKPFDADGDGKYSLSELKVALGM